MSDLRPLSPDQNDWPPTVPGELPPVVAEPAASTRRTPATGRPQPPLKEVLKGLDARELEGQTVFDQLFGLPADADLQPPGR